jgi:hypothetical protein
VVLNVSAVQAALYDGAHGARQCGQRHAQHLGPTSRQQPPHVQTLHSTQAQHSTQHSTTWRENSSTEGMSVRNSLGPPVASSHATRAVCDGQGTSNSSWH